MTKPMTLKEFQDYQNSDVVWPIDYTTRVEAALKHREELIELCLRLENSGKYSVQQNRIIQDILNMAKEGKTPVQLAAEKGFEGT